MPITLEEMFSDDPERLEQYKKHGLIGAFYSDPQLGPLGGIQNPRTPEGIEEVIALVVDGILRPFSELPDGRIDIILDGGAGGHVGLATGDPETLEAAALQITDEQRDRAQEFVKQASENIEFARTLRQGGLLGPEGSD